MAILKNKTQNNFTMISNIILKDRTVSIKDRGMFCLLCSLPDDWNFSINGIRAIVPDGTDSIRASIKSLEEHGYLTRTKTRTPEGKYISIVELFTGEDAEKDNLKFHDGKSDTDNPSPNPLNEYSAMDNTAQDNNINIDNTYKIQTANTNTSDAADINICSKETTTLDEAACRKMVADNIQLDLLLSRSDLNHDTINNIYKIIVDAVYSSEKTDRIKSREMSREEIVNTFMLIDYDDVLTVYGKITNPTMKIHNIVSYTKTMLFISVEEKTLGGASGASSNNSAYNEGHKSTNQFNNFEQRQYSPDEWNELEQRLIKN